MYGCNYAKSETCYICGKERPKPYNGQFKGMGDYIKNLQDTIEKIERKRKC